MEEKLDRPGKKTLGERVWLQTKHGVLQLRHWGGGGGYINIKTQNSFCQTSEVKLMG